MQDFQIKLSLAPELDVARLNVLIQAIKQSLGALGKDIKLIDAAKLQADINTVAKAQDNLQREITETTSVAGNLKKKFDETSLGGKAFSKAFDFNQITQAFQTLVSTLDQLSQPYIQFESGLADLSAITGVQGEALDAFGEKAKNLAEQFGGSAVQQLDAFKGVLSRLGPDIAKSPEALERMSIAINTMSKASGLDATSSMQALTTSMLQYNVSLDDPLKASDEMTKMMNVLAAGAKEGASEIPQVASAIEVAGVAAYGAKLSFEEVNAAVQALATGGKYGAEAGTALRNVLGLLQKQAGPGTEQLKKMGLSINDLAKTLTTQGLAPTLKILSGGINQLGTDAEKNVAMMNLFGVESSAAAGILLRSADSIQTLTTKLTGTQTAFEQAAINMDTTAGKVDRFKAVINNVLTDVFSALGSGVGTIVGSLSSLSPVIMSLMGLSQIFTLLQGSVGKFAIDLMAKLIPSLFVTDVATGKTAFSFTALWTAITGPVGIVIAAIVAVGAALYLLYQNVEPVRLFMDRLFEGVKVVALEFWKIIQDLGSALLSYGELLYIVFIEPLIDVVVFVYDLISAVATLGGTVEETSDGFDGFRFVMDSISKVITALKASIDGVIAVIRSLKDTFGDAISKILSGDIVGGLATLSQAGSRAGKAFMGAVEGAIRDEAKEKILDAMNSAFESGVEIKAKLKESESQSQLVDDFKKLSDNIGKLEVKASTQGLSNDDIKTLDEYKKKAGEVSAKIAEVNPTMSDGIKSMIDSQGNLIEVYDINIAKATEFAASQNQGYNQDLLKAQEAYTKQINNQGLYYTDNVNKLKEIQKEIEKAEALGDTNTADTKRKQYEEQKKILAETVVEMQKAITEGGKNNMLVVDKINIPDDLKAQFQSQINAMLVKAKKEGIDKQVSELFTITETLDKNNKIGELVQKYKEAKTDIERNDIAKEIQKSVPGAVQGVRNIVDENGNLIEILEVNTEKAIENAEANKQRYSNEILAKQQNFQNSLNKEVGTYQDTKSELDELANKIRDAKNPEEVKKLQGEYSALKGKLESSKEAIIKMAVETVKFGGDSSAAVRTLMTSFGLTEEQARALLNQQIKQTNEAKATEQAVKDIGSAFTESLSAAKKAQADATNTYAAAIADLKKAQQSGDASAIIKAEQKVNEERAKGIDIVKKNKAEQKLLEDSYNEAGKTLGTVEEKKQAASKKSTENIKSQFEILQEQYEQQSKILNNDLWQVNNSEELLRLQQKREKSIQDEINIQNRKSETLQKQLQLLKDTFNITTDAEGNVIEIKPILSEAKQKEFDKKLEDNLKKKQEIINKWGLSLDEQGNIINFKPNLSEKEKAKATADMSKWKKDNENIYTKFGLKSEDVDKVKTQVKDLNKDISESDIANLELKIKYEAEIEKVQSALKDYENKKLQMDIELGLANPEAILNNLKKELSQQQAQLNKMTLFATLNPMSVTPEFMKGLADLKNNILTTENDIQKERKSLYEKDIQEYEQISQKKIEMAQKELDARFALEQTLNNAFGAAAENTALNEKEAELQRLEKMKQEERISEDQYNKLKEDAEKKHQKKLTQIKAAEIALRIKQEIDAQAEIAKNDRDKAKAELEAAKKRGLAGDELKKYEDKFNEAESIYLEKTDKFKQYQVALEGQTNEMFASFFAGDNEAMKENARAMMATVGEILKKEITAMILSIVLGPGTQTYLAALPFPLNIISVPIIYGLVTAAVSAIADPVIGSLTSFSTGGRVDSPTVAVVGDASLSRAGANTEWIVRDIDIQRLIREALTQNNNLIMTAFTNQLQKSESQINNIFALWQKDVTIDKYSELLITPLLIEFKNVSGAIVGLKNTIATVPNETIIKMEVEQQDFTNIERQLDELKVSVIDKIQNEIKQINLETVFDSGVISEAIVNNFNTQKLEKKIDELIQVAKLNKDVFLDTAKVTSEINSYNNRNARRRIL